MDRRSLLAGAAAGLAAAVLAPAEAFAATWVALGSRTVAPFGDHDSIRVGAGAGRFNRLRLRVSGNAVFLYDLDVVFTNGQHFDVPVRLLFLPGSTSRIIDLPGNTRHIRRVDFTYGKLLGGGRATVKLEGRRV